MQAKNVNCRGQPVEHEDLQQQHDAESAAARAELATCKRCYTHARRAGNAEQWKGRGKGGSTREGKGRKVFARKEGCLACGIAGEGAK